MQDEQGPPPNSYLRRIALEKAHSLYLMLIQRGEVSDSLEHQVEDITDIANKFYEFLIGEVK